jgi:hypothetical protein
MGNHERTEKRNDEAVLHKNLCESTPFMLTALLCSPRVQSRQSTRLKLDVKMFIIMFSTPSVLSLLFCARTF